MYWPVGMCPDLIKIRHPTLKMVAPHIYALTLKPIHGRLGLSSLSVLQPIGTQYITAMKRVRRKKERNKERKRKERKK